MQMIEPEMKPAEMVERIKLSFEPEPEEYYRARISMLEKENMKLTEQLKESDYKYECVVSKNVQLKKRIDALERTLLNFVEKAGWNK